MIHLWTDGATWPEHKVGAWAFLKVENGIETTQSGLIPNGDSSYAELYAAMRALLATNVGDEMIVHTDNLFVLGVLKGKIKKRKKFYELIRVAIEPLVENRKVIATQVRRDERCANHYTVHNLARAEIKKFQEQTSRVDPAIPP